jgi:hypothetical protein
VAAKSSSAFCKKTRERSVNSEMKVLGFRPLAGKRVPNPCPHSPLFMRLSEPICGGERVSCFSAGSKVKNSPQSLILCGAAEN